MVVTNQQAALVRSMHGINQWQSSMAIDSLTPCDCVLNFVLYFFHFHSNGTQSHQIFTCFQLNNIFICRIILFHVQSVDSYLPCTNDDQLVRTDIIIWRSRWRNSIKFIWTKTVCFRSFRAHTFFIQYSICLIAMDIPRPHNRLRSATISVCKIGIWWLWIF